MFNNPNASRTCREKVFSLIFLLWWYKKQTEDELLEEVTTSEYKYGFTTDIESDTIPKGLSEEEKYNFLKRTNQNGC